MTSEEPIILSSELNGADNTPSPDSNEPPRAAWKRVLLFVALAAALLLLAVIIFFAVKIYWFSPPTGKQPAANPNGSASATNT